MNKILIVDSSAHNSELMEQLLDSNNYETMSSESGSNALIKIKYFNPDLVILDLDLADISSYDVCKRIKNNQDTKYIMVLCITGSDTKEARTRAMRSGADDFLEKSFDALLILPRIQSLLSVKNLRDQLKQNFIELEEKNRILEFQLSMAQKVQRALMPDINFNFNDVQIVSKYLPALDIGGDLYNLQKIDSDSFGILIGDVSGHGISAALLTAMFNSMFINLVKQNYQPNELLCVLNNEFAKSFESGSIDVYATMFYAIVNTKTHTIYFSNAGQTLPVLVASDEIKELESSGVPIGIIENSSYELQTIQYQKGDLLLLHTDGLVDCFYKDKPDEFNIQLKKAFADTKANDNLHEIIEILLSQFYNYDVNELGKPAIDDVTAILCRL